MEKKRYKSFKLRLSPFICMQKVLELQFFGELTQNPRMNKLFPLLLFITLSASSSFGQLGVGLRGGFGGSASSQELVTGMERKFGTAPTFGLMLNYNLDLHFSGGIEFNYHTFSETQNFSAAFGPQIPISYDPEGAKTATRKSFVNYLNIPIFGRATFGEKKTKWFISFGPYVGIGLNGKVEGGMKPSVRRLDSNYTAKFKPGDYRKFDIGGMLGGGLQRQIKTNGTLFIEARFMLGFVDFNNDPTSRQRDGYVQPPNRGGEAYIRPTGTWRSANVTVGYFHTFKLPKKKSSSGGQKKAGKQGRGRI